MTKRLRRRFVRFMAKKATFENPVSGPLMRAMGHVPVELLLVGWPSARRLLDATLLLDATREYVVHGRHVPSSWVRRKLSRRPA
jgi:hypothetical protein